MERIIPVNEKAPSTRSGTVGGGVGSVIGETSCIHARTKAL